MDNLNIDGMSIYEKLDLYNKITNKDIIVPKNISSEVENILNYSIEKQFRNTDYIFTLETDKYLYIDNNSFEIAKLAHQHNKKVLINTPNIYNLSQIEKISLINAHIIGNIVIFNSLFEDINIIYGYNNSLIINDDNYIENIKIYNYLTKLATSYNLVNAIKGCVNNVDTVNQEVGYQSMISLYSAFSESPNYILEFGGSLKHGKYTSYEKLIVDMEVLSILKFYFDDLRVDKKTLDIDVIKEGVESCGFLKLKNTFKLCRKSVWLPTIALPKKLKLDDTPFNIINQSINKQIDSLVEINEKKEEK